MNNRVFQATMLVVGSLAFALPGWGRGDGKPVDPETFSSFRTMYQYDKDLPFDIDKQEEQDVPGMEGAPPYYRLGFTFRSKSDERVPGLLWEPRERKGPYPCILFLHGLGGTRMLGEAYAFELIKLGYTVLALDAPHHGDRYRGKDLVSGTDFNRMRDAFIQCTIDYRRILDYLATRSEIDARRISLIGVDMGATIGAVLAALDVRVKCPILLLGGADSGLVSRLSRFQQWQLLRKEHPEINFDEVSKIFAPADSLNFIDKISPRRVLMINGKTDELMPVQASKLLHTTAKEPKTVVWLEAGHGLPSAQVLPLIKDWLKKNL